MYEAWKSGVCYWTISILNDITRQYTKPLFKNVLKSISQDVLDTFSQNVLYSIRQDVF